MAYERCGARLSQGDIIRAPVGIFGLPADIADPAILTQAPRPLGPDAEGTAILLPRAPRATPYVLRAWETMALVISADCVIERAECILVAPILPITAAVPSSVPAIRAGQFRAAFYLPPEEHPLWSARGKAWPEAFADLNRVTSVTKALAGAKRLMTLDADSLDRLHFTLVRFLVTRALSARGHAPLGDLGQGLVPVATHRGGHGHDTGGDTLPRCSTDPAAHQSGQAAGHA